MPCVSPYTEDILTVSVTHFNILRLSAHRALRRGSVVNGITTDFVVDGSTVVREHGSGNRIATYSAGLYKRDDSSGVVRRYLYDGLGSVLMAADPNGNVTASRKHDVYGSVRAGQAGISKRRFVGQLGHTSYQLTGYVELVGDKRWLISCPG